ncbi:MAG: sulfatase-like hydrolase/transferase [Luteitalea sp.]|nr:sulfatase-like hydrolase/transferase [Luteitalea sp.]
MRAVCLALIALATMASATTQLPEREKLNVLFIVADDLNTDMGSYGAPVETPHLDRLAQRGVRFERAYCQFPLCSPSRASFLTGRRPDQTGVLTNPRKNQLSPHFRERIPDTVTLPQLFKEHGWFSARVGKLYHYGVPLHIGTASLDDYMSWDFTVNPRGRDRDRLDQVFSLVPGQFGGTLSWLADDGEDAEQTDGIGALEAVRLLERFKNDERPFFLAVGFYRPHTPYVAPKKYFDGYPRDGIELPALSADDEARRPEAGYASAKKEQDSMTDAQRREAIQAYHASTTFMDAQAGHVLDALERLDLRERTVVVFTSDHGYHLADHGLWQKMSLFERSARVPLVIAAPGAKANGQVARGVVELVDLYPTLAALSQLEAPDYLDGVSLQPMLDDATKSVREAAFTQVRDGYSVRNDRWRYIEWAEGAKGAQLYDMERDADETNNLVEDPEHTDTVAELKALLETYRQKGADR